MEGFITIDIVNSAPPSECEESDEIIILSKTPASISPLEFLLDEAFFSPVGISALSSPKFVDMILSSQSYLGFPQDKPVPPESPEKSKTKTKELHKCRTCGSVSEVLTLTSYSCHCKL